MTLARFHLGRILQEAGEHARAVEVLAPLAEQAEQPDASSEAIESLVIWASSESELGKAAAGNRRVFQVPGAAAQGRTGAAGACRPCVGQRQARQARGRPGRRAPLDQRVSARRRRGRHAPPSGGTSLRRERLDRTRPNCSARWPSRGPPSRTCVGSAFRGSAGPNSNSKSYDESAAAFEQVFERFSATSSAGGRSGLHAGPRPANGGQAGRGRQSVRGGISEARSALAQRRSRSWHPAVRLNTRFLAGVQAANLLAQSKHYDESDAAYRLVVDRFPKAPQTGQVLFDWANMLYVAKKDPEQQRPRPRNSDADRPGFSRERRTGQRPAVPGGTRSCSTAKRVSAEKAFREVLADPKADAKVREDGLSRLIAVAADKEDWASVRELAEKFLAQFPKSRGRCRSCG